MKKQWNIAGLEIPAGEKVNIMLSVPGTEEKIPATFINGKEPGQTLLVNSGLHGGEYPGIQAAIELSAELNPAEMSGQVVLTHPLSLDIFLSGLSRASAKDNMNPNRIYPPNPNGTVAEKIATFFWNEILIKVDFCLDLHAGGYLNYLYPHTYVAGACSEETYQKSLAGAMAMGVPYLLRSRDEVGAYNYAAKEKGIPGVCAERGDGGGWSEEDKDLYKKDARNLMRHMNILHSPKEPYKYKPQISTERVYEMTEEGGCWYADPSVKVGEVVKKGQKLGEIRDYFGNHIRTIYAKYEGVMLIVSATLSVRGGSDGYVVLYAKYEKYV